MGFQVSKTAAGIASGGGGGTGGYLTAGKLGDGDHYRVAIVSEDPLEYFTVWGETDEGQKKPFRFTSEPNADEILSELGDFKQRMNYEGTALEAPKFGMSFFVFDFADSKIKVFEMTQKTLIKELDKLCNDDDYSEIAAWDLKINRTGLKMNTEYSILPSPRKKGSQDQIDAAWKVAQDQGYDINQLLVGGNPFGEKL
jgi:hypothetical protein